MNFGELQQIIRYLRKTVNCTMCQANYENEGIEVLSTYEDQGLFNLSCKKCSHQLMVHITISDEEKKASEEKKSAKPTIRAHRALTEKDITANIHGPNISTDDVINIHTFLNQFNGDFKELFSK